MTTTVEVGADRSQQWRPAARRGPRYIAQDVLTKRFLDWDLPLADVETTHVLSGSKTITATISPEIGYVGELGLTPRGTWIHVEEDGEIRASGILQPGSIDGDTLKVDAAGFTSYPHLVRYDGDYSVIGADPCDIVRHLWAHVQAKPNGDLGVTVNAETSPVRLGTKKKNADFQTSSGSSVQFESGPYQLNWWTAKQCGAEIDELAKQTPFDYHEQDFWNDDKTDVSHRLQLGHPRLGGKRTDLAFVEDENLRDVVAVADDASLLCTEVHVIGAGEGRKAVRGSYVGAVPGRLRQPVYVEDSRITSAARARAAAEDEFHRRQASTGVEQITIDARHPNAAYGTFYTGDDILIRARPAYLGRIALWHRITEFALSERNTVAVLKVRRSDSFRYSAPTGEGGA